MAFEKTDIKEDEKPKASTPKDAAAAKKKADVKPSQSRPTPKKKPGPATLEKKLTENVKGIGMALATAGQVDDGFVLMVKGPALCHAWCDVAEQNAQVKRILTAFVETGVWSGVVFSSLSVALPIAQNHGFARGVPNPFGISEEDYKQAFSEMPESMQAIVRVRAAAQAMRQQTEPVEYQDTPGPVSGPNGTGVPQGPQATAPPAHEPE